MSRVDQSGVEQSGVEESRSRSGVEQSRVGRTVETRRISLSIVQQSRREERTLHPHKGRDPSNVKQLPGLRAGGFQNRSAV
eukprot:1271526-Pyramimonas_sp.AAC.1